MESQLTEFLNTFCGSDNHIETFPGRNEAIVWFNSEFGGTVGTDLEGDKAVTLVPEDDLPLESFCLGVSHENYSL